MTFIIWGISTSHDRQSFAATSGLAGGRARACGGRCLAALARWRGGGFFAHCSGVWGRRSLRRHPSPRGALARRRAWCRNWRFYWCRNGRRNRCRIRIKVRIRCDSRLGRNAQLRTQNRRRHARQLGSSYLGGSGVGAAPVALKPGCWHYRDPAR